MRLKQKECASLITKFNHVLTTGTGSQHRKNAVFTGGRIDLFWKMKSRKQWGAVA